MKIESEVAQSCPTPSDPMDCSPPGPSIHGIFQARALEWVDMPSLNLAVPLLELSYLKKTRLHKAIHTSILLAILKQQTSEKNPWI